MEHSVRPTLSVFYDGSCPMCVREVALYRRQSPADIIWHDLSSLGLSIPRDTAGYQPSHAVLMRRFHVHSSEGQWLDGAAAFALIWQRLGFAWRVLAQIGRLPGGLRLMDAVYAMFLSLRPGLQRAVGALLRPSAVPVPMIPAIRSDHAGETGAVWIYRVMLALSRDRRLRPMLEEHAEQERQHLAAMNELLPWRQRSWLLPLWRVAGATTGAVAALGGRRWILATIAAVERFVDRHYEEQIEQLSALIAAEPARDLRSSAAVPSACATGLGPGAPADGTPCAASLGCAVGPSLVELLSLLERFRADECRHRDDAQRLLDRQEAEPAIDASPSAIPAGRWLRLWCALVDRGSRVAVRAAKAI
jgi:demethoxyubiquinone hydroxylase (CLK1/Coq7/Cat5 family)/predicted DCC family thiol-disulfide oxidoreductase YuxK